MKINHPVIKSDVYELVKTVEFDIELDDEWSIRIEILKNTEKAEHFRCRVWELEMHRLTPSFPRDEDHEPAHILDVPILVERCIWSHRVKYPNDDIIAPNVEAALEIVIDDLKEFLQFIANAK